MGKHTRSHGKNRPVPYENGSSSASIQSSADKEPETDKCEH